MATQDNSIYRECEVLKSTDIPIPGSDGLVGRYSICEGPSSPTKGIVVYVNGGPGTPPAEKPENDVVMFLMAGYDVIEPIYFGTGERSKMNRPQVDIHKLDEIDEISIAIVDVKAALAWARQRYPIVIISGASAGAQIAAASCQGACADGMLMLSPALQSATEFWEKKIKNNPDMFPASGFTLFDLKNRPIDPKRVDTKTLEPYRRAAAIGFYGTKYRNSSMLDVLEANRNLVPKLMVVGSEDDRIGLEHLPELERAADTHNMRIALIQGAGHDYGPANEAAAPSFAFLAKPAAKGRISNPGAACLSVQVGYSETCK